MSKIGQIRALVQNGLFYLSEHAMDEAWADGFDVYDVEHAIIMGDCAERGHRKGNMKSSGSRWMAAPSAPFAGLQDREKFESLQCMKTTLDLDREVLL